MLNARHYLRQGLQQVSEEKVMTRVDVTHENRSRQRRLPFPFRSGWQGAAFFAFFQMRGEPVSSSVAAMTLSALIGRPTLISFVTASSRPVESNPQPVSIPF